MNNEGKTRSVVWSLADLGYDVFLETKYNSYRVSITVDGITEAIHLDVDTLHILLVSDVVKEFNNRLKLRKWRNEGLTKHDKTN